MEWPIGKQPKKGLVHYGHHNLHDSIDAARKKKPHGHHDHIGSSFTRAIDED